MRSLPDELLLSAGSVGGRSSDTQNLQNGLQPTDTQLMWGLQTDTKLMWGLQAGDAITSGDKHQADRHIPI